MALVPEDRVAVARCCPTILLSPLARVAGRRGQQVDPQSRHQQQVAQIKATQDAQTLSRYAQQRVVGQRAVVLVVVRVVVRVVAAVVVRLAAALLPQRLRCRELPTHRPQ